MMSSEVQASRAAREAAERFRVTLDLFETGVRMRRQALVRANPQATADQIDCLLRAWLLERPGAEQGDGPQRP